MAILCLLYSIVHSPRSKSFLVQEKVLMEVDSEFITLMDRFPGKLKVSTTHVYFTADRSKETTSTVQDFAWPLTELREVHLRRYNLRRTALEFFLVDQTNYFINFSKDVSTVFLCCFHYFVFLENCYWRCTANTHVRRPQ